MGASSASVRDLEITVPPELGFIDYSFQGSSDKTVIYIQDAHDSLEAQERIAQIIHHLVQTQGVRVVLEEAYEGTVPTDAYFGHIRDAETKKEVAYRLMDQFRLGGAEYAHINRSTEFELVGADDIRLHLENIEWYRRSVAQQDIIQKDLQVLTRHLQKLADRYFPKEIKDWMKWKDRFAGQKMDLYDYLKRASGLVRSEISEFPAIRLILEIAGSKQDAPELKARLESMPASALFQEIERLERIIAERYLSGEREQRLFRYHQGIGLIQRLNVLEVSAEEYDAARSLLADLRFEDLAAFIVAHGGKPVALSKKWRENIRHAIRFYEIARERDRAIGNPLDDFLNREERAAILVFGGFHRSGIEAILKAKGLSYIVVSPKISGVSEEHQTRYRRLMALGSETYSRVSSQSTPYERLFETAYFFPEPARREVARILEAVETRAGKRSEVRDLRHEGMIAQPPLQRKRKRVTVGVEALKSELKKYSGALRKVGRALHISHQTVANLIDRYQLTHWVQKLRKDRRIPDYDPGKSRFRKLLIQYRAQRAPIAAVLGISIEQVSALTRSHHLKALAKKLRRGIASLYPGKARMVQLIKKYQAREHLIAEELNVQQPTVWKWIRDHHHRRLAHQLRASRSEVRGLDETDEYLASLRNISQQVIVEHWAGKDAEKVEDDYKKQLNEDLAWLEENEAVFSGERLELPSEFRSGDLVRFIPIGLTNRYTAIPKDKETMRFAVVLGAQKGTEDIMLLYENRHTGRVLRVAKSAMPRIYERLHISKVKMYMLLLKELGQKAYVSDQHEQLVWDRLNDLTHLDLHQITHWMVGVLEHWNGTGFAFQPMEKADDAQPGDILVNVEIVELKRHLALWFKTTDHYRVLSPWLYLGRDYKTDDNLLLFDHNGRLIRISNVNFIKIFKKVPFPGEAPSRRSEIRSELLAVHGARYPTFVLSDAVFDLLDPKSSAWAMTIADKTLRRYRHDLWRKTAHGKKVLRGIALAAKAGLTGAMLQVLFDKGNVIFIRRATVMNPNVLIPQGHALKIGTEDLVQKTWWEERLHLETFRLPMIIWNKISEVILKSEIAAVKELRRITLKVHRLRSAVLSNPWYAAFIPTEALALLLIHLYGERSTWFRIEEIFPKSLQILLWQMREKAKPSPFEIERLKDTALDVEHTRARSELRGRAEESVNKLILRIQKLRHDLKNAHAWPSELWLRFSDDMDEVIQLVKQDEFLKAAIKLHSVGPAKASRYREWILEAHLKEFVNLENAVRVRKHSVAAMREAEADENLTDDLILVAIEYLLQRTRKVINPTNVAITAEISLAKLLVRMKKNPQIGITIEYAERIRRRRESGGSKEARSELRAGASSNLKNSLIKHPAYGREIRRWIERNRILVNKENQVYADRMTLEALSKRINAFYYAEPGIEESFYALSEFEIRQYLKAKRATNPAYYASAEEVRFYLEVRQYYRMSNQPEKLKRENPGLYQAALNHGWFFKKKRLVDPIYRPDPPATHEEIVPSEARSEMRSAEIHGFAEALWNINLEDAHELEVLGVLIAALERIDSMEVHPSAHQLIILVETLGHYKTDLDRLEVLQELSDYRDDENKTFLHPESLFYLYRIVPLKLEGRKLRLDAKIDEEITRMIRESVRTMSDTNEMKVWNARQALAQFARWGFSRRILRELKADAVPTREKIGVIEQIKDMVHEEDRIAGRTARSELRGAGEKREPPTSFITVFNNLPIHQAAAALAPRVAEAIRQDTQSDTKEVILSLQYNGSGDLALAALAPVRPLQAGYPVSHRALAEHAHIDSDYISVMLLYDADGRTLKSITIFKYVLPSDQYIETERLMRAVVKEVAKIQQASRSEIRVRRFKNLPTGREPSEATKKLMRWAKRHQGKKMPVLQRDLVKHFGVDQASVSRILKRYKVKTRGVTGRQEPRGPRTVETKAFHQWAKRHANRNVRATSGELQKRYAVSDWYVTHVGRKIYKIRTNLGRTGPRPGKRSEMRQLNDDVRPIPNESMEQYLERIFEGRKNISILDLGSGLAPLRESDASRHPNTDFIERVAQSIPGLKPKIYALDITGLGISERNGEAVSVKFKPRQVTTAFIDIPREYPELMHQMDVITINAPPIKSQAKFFEEIKALLKKNQRTVVLVRINIHDLSVFQQLTKSFIRGLEKIQRTDAVRVEPADIPTGYPDTQHVVRIPLYIFASKRAGRSEVRTAPVRIFRDLSYDKAPGILAKALSHMEKKGRYRTTDLKEHYEVLMVMGENIAEKKITSIAVSPRKFTSSASVPWWSHNALAIKAQIHGEMTTVSIYFDVKTRIPKSIIVWPGDRTREGYLRLLRLMQAALEKNYPKDTVENIELKFFNELFEKTEWKPLEHNPGFSPYFLLAEISALPDEPGGKSRSETRSSQKPSGMQALFEALVTGVRAKRFEGKLPLFEINRERSKSRLRWEQPLLNHKIEIREVELQGDMLTLRYIKREDGRDHTRYMDFSPWHTTLYHDGYFFDRPHINRYAGALAGLATDEQERLYLLIKYEMWDMLNAVQLSAVNEDFKPLGIELISERDSRVLKMRTLAEVASRAEVRSDDANAKRPRESRIVDEGIMQIIQLLSEGSDIYQSALSVANTFQSRSLNPEEAKFAIWEVLQRRGRLSEPVRRLGERVTGYPLTPQFYELFHDLVRIAKHHKDTDLVNQWFSEGEDAGADYTEEPDLTLNDAVTGLLYDLERSGNQALKSNKETEKIVHQLEQIKETIKSARSELRSSFVIARPVAVRESNGMTLGIKFMEINTRRGVYEIFKQIIRDQTRDPNAWRRLSDIKLNFMDKDVTFSPVGSDTLLQYLDSLMLSDPENIIHPNQIISVELILSETLLHVGRSETRRGQGVSVNPSVILNYPNKIIFSIEAEQLDRLPAQQWKELLGLKLLNEEKLHILILDGRSGIYSDRIAELQGLEGVYFEAQLPQLPKGVRGIHFGNMEQGEPAGSGLSPRVAARMTDYFGLFDGSFGTALLYALHEGHLPGLDQKNGYLYDPQNLYVFRVVEALAVYQITGKSA